MCEPEKITAKCLPFGKHHNNGNFFKNSFSIFENHLICLKIKTIPSKYFKKKKVFNHYNRNGFQILHIISFLHTVTQWIKNIPPDTIKVWINWRNKYIFWNVMQLSSNAIEIEMFLYFSLYVDVLDRCRYFKEFTCLRILSLQTNHLSLFLFKCMF